MNIYEKLLEVRKSVNYLQKTSQGHAYKYTGSSQVLSSVRKAINDNGLLLIPRIDSFTCEDFVTNNSKKLKFTELEMSLTWVNVENPDERVICKWYGQGMDDMERGLGKALTYAEKYFILKFFNIPTDIDDPDAFSSSDSSDSETTTNNVDDNVAKSDPPPPRDMDAPASAAHMRYIKSLSVKHGFTVSDNLTKAGAAKLIDQYGN